MHAFISPTQKKQQKKTKIALHPFRNETNTFITRPVLLLNLQSTNVIEGHKLLTFRLKKAPTARSPLFNFQPSVILAVWAFVPVFLFLFFQTAHILFWEQIPPPPKKKSSPLFFLCRLSE